MFTPFSYAVRTLLTSQPKYEATQNGRPADAETSAMSETQSPLAASDHRCLIANLWVHNLVARVYQPQFIRIMLFRQPHYRVNNTGGPLQCLLVLVTIEQ